MSIFRAELDQVSEADLDELIADGIHEGLTIEYKQAVYGTADGDKREFLKDLSSFANSSGGHLILGLQEAQGVPVGKVAYNQNPDDEIQRMQNLMTTSLDPRIVGVRFRPIALAAGGHAFVVRIPKSWNPPHRVIHTGWNKFFVRSSAGAHEASVEELRSIFEGGANTNDRLIRYRSERLHKIASNDAAAPLSDDDQSRLILHIVPLSAFGSEHRIDVGMAFEEREGLKLLGMVGYSPRINFTGFINVANNPVGYGYTQIDREGRIEAVRLRVAYTLPNQLTLWISMRDFGESIFKRLPVYFRTMEHLQVPPPFALMITLVGVKGAILAADSVLNLDQSPIDRATLELPVQIIESYGAEGSYKQSLRPACDALWNAVGYASSGNFVDRFQANGEWIPPQH